MDFQVPTINKQNESNFFYELEVGDVFKFEISNYIWEDISGLAISQGKKIKQIEKNNFLFNIVSCFGGIVIRDIKQAANNIRDEEILRLQGELSSCYNRIDVLETQIGIRGVERLKRCDVCKKHVFPYQSKIDLDNSIEHIECNLGKIIKELENSNKKKDDTLKKWIKDSQRIGSENQTLRIERENLKDSINELQNEVNSLIENNEMLKNKDAYNNTTIEDFNNNNLIQLSKIKDLENINIVYENLLRSIYILMVRVMRLLGDNTNEEFIPIPSISLSGEQKIELKGLCKPLFNDLLVLLNSINEIL